VVDPAAPAEGATNDQNTEPKKTDEPVQAVPETYETFKLPEGMEATPDFQSAISSLAKDFALTQEKAQLLADKAATLVNQAHTAQTETLTRARSEWVSSVKSDPEIGGAKTDENLALANKTVEKFNPKLTEVLNLSGLGDHPEMVRFLVSVGRNTSGDSIVVGTQGAAGATHGNIMQSNQAFADAIYGKSK
jgi:hypothetical protein